MYDAYYNHYSYRYMFRKSKENVENTESNVEMQRMDSIIEDINSMISELTGGSLEFKPDEATFFNDKYYDEPFKVNNLSTGLKAISLLQCILHYRVFKEKSVLILDEPEINLHPE